MKGALGGGGGLAGFATKIMQLRQRIRISIDPLLTKITNFTGRYTKSNIFENLTHSCGRDHLDIIALINDASKVYYGIKNFFTK